MRRITYGGTVFLTGDRIAHALAVYARALARRGLADIVQVPARSSGGAVGSIEMLVGPAAQLVSEPWDDVELELEDDDRVAEWERLAAELEDSRPVGDSTH